MHAFSAWYACSQCMFGSCVSFIKILPNYINFNLIYGSMINSYKHNDKVIYLYYSVINVTTCRVMTEF